jgi:hypothetical protein
MIHEVEGVALEVDRPGLLNAHDHLEFALFPRLGRGPYPNAAAWARDVYQPERPPLRQHLAMPKELRLLWGGLRNLLAGATTVWHHNPYHPCFDGDFPVRVERIGWAHSLAFEQDIRGRWEATPEGALFVIHAGEGTDEGAAREVFRLEELGVLAPRTVLVHCVGFDAAGWELVRRRGAAVVWCPRSNLFTLGKTLSPESVPAGVRLLLGTDSALTAEGDLLDEICVARRLGVNSAPSQAESLCYGSPPRLVVAGGRIRLIDPDLARALPPSLRDEFYPIHVSGRPPVLVRWNVPALLEETRSWLGGEVRLAGREVRA